MGDYGKRIWLNVRQTLIKKRGAREAISVNRFSTASLALNEEVMDFFNILSIVFGALGVAFGIHGYFSSRALNNKILDEKDLIADKIKDFKSDWVHKQKMIQNEAEQRPGELVNMYLWKLRIEEVEKNIEVLDRFIERLEKTK